MLADLIVSTLQVVAGLFLLAWVLAAMVIGWLIWKYRNKTWEDDIEWDVEPYDNYVVMQPNLKEAEYGGRYDRTS